jgi:hypothetical protein
LCRFGYHIDEGCVVNVFVSGGPGNLADAPTSTPDTSATMQWHVVDPGVHSKIYEAAKLKKLTKIGPGQYAPPETWMQESGLNWWSFETAPGDIVILPPMFAHWVQMKQVPYTCTAVHKRHGLR